MGAVYYKPLRSSVVSEIEYNVILDPDEIGEIIPVIKSAWGMDTVGLLIKDIASAMRYHGGVVIGAYDDNRMIGMHFSFPGYRMGKVYLYSHQTGVIKEKKYSGIGYGLKIKQKEWALENGYDLIAWTFDPIMSLNASFNLRKLGTISRCYIDNFYGKMDDAINRGIPTDRVVTEWWIRKEKTVSGAFEPVNSFDSEFSFDFRELSADIPEKVEVKVPRDFTELKKKDRDIAIKWRLYLRKTLKDLFGRGYTAVGFDKNENAYMLEINSRYPGEDSPSVFRPI